MLKYEIKKLLVKQYALFFIAMVLVLEFFSLSSVYKEVVFDNEIIRQSYYEYMDVMQGKLDEKKEKYIMYEVQKVLNAKSKLTEIQNKLYNNEYFNEDEYLSEYLKIQPYLMKSDAVNMVYEKYKYSVKNPSKRYLFPYFPDGFLRDKSDIIMLLFIISTVTMFFVSEEKTKIILLIRSCESTQKNTFLSKIIVIFIMLLVVHIAVSFLEFTFILKFVGMEYMSYPIQSIEYFSGCRYDISILKAFIYVQIIKLLGYNFIAAFTVLLTVMFKKVIVSTALPLTTCLLQQFVFEESNKAYYLPTGLLRALGYFRGDSYKKITNFTETIQVKSFSEVPQNIFIVVIFSSVLFIFFSIIYGMNYYKRIVIRKHVKVASIMALILILFSGCNNNEKETDVYFNLRDLGFLAQNGNYYFTNVIEVLPNGILSSDIIKAFEKDGESSFNVMRDPFDNDMQSGIFCVVRNNLYIFKFLNEKGFEITKISLENFEMEKIFAQSVFDKSAFLGLKKQNDVVLDKTVLRFFTDEKNLFLITTDNELYCGDMSLNNLECIISDGIYQDNLVFDGNTIYYVNFNLELRAYDLSSCENSLIAGDFARAIALDDEYLIYSNSEGIFSLNLLNNKLKKLSKIKADAISCSNSKIVYSENDVLYLLENNNSKEIYNGRLLYFGCLSDSKSVFCRSAGKEGFNDFMIDIDS